jgi:hypothetical protein
MSDPLKKRRDAILERCKAEGIINVRKLIRQTRVVIKTNEEIYELEVGTPKFGVVLIGSNKRFENRIKAVVTGSIDPITNIFFPKIIGRGLRIILRYQGNPTIRTAPVLEAKIIGPDNSYEFRMWEK